MFEPLIILWPYQPHAGVSRASPATRGDLELVERRGGLCTLGFPQRM